MLNSEEEKLKTIFARASVRQFLDKPIPDQVMDLLFKAALCAPTSSHIQAFSIVKVNQPTARQQIYEITGKQEWILSCPQFLIFCADLNKVCAFSGLSVDSPVVSQDAYLASLMDAALVGMTLSLAAEQLSIGNVMIGSIRNDVEAIAQLLQLPEGVFPLFGMCLGYYEFRKKPKPRLPQHMFVFDETYELPQNSAQLLSEYHEKLKNYYEVAALEHKGLRNSNKTWIQSASNAIQNEKRKLMGEVLKKRGFAFWK